MTYRRWLQVLACSVTMSACSSSASNSGSDDDDPNNFDNPNAGELDPSFGQGGSLILEGYDEVRRSAVVVEPDGKIVFAARRGEQPPELVRLLLDGSFDPSFGAGGHVTLPSASDAVARLPDGSFLVGVSDNSDGSGKVMHFSANGTPDTAYGTSGTGSVGRHGVRGIFPLQDGKVLVFTPGGVGRLMANGVLDTGYATSGLFSSARWDESGPCDQSPHPTTYSSHAKLLDAVAQPDGGLVFTLVVETNSVYCDIARDKVWFQRLGPDGTLDESFVLLLLYTTDAYGNRHGYVRGSLRLLADGRVLCAVDTGARVIATNGDEEFIANPESCSGPYCSREPILDVLPLGDGALEANKALTLSGQLRRVTLGYAPAGSQEGATTLLTKLDESFKSTYGSLPSQGTAQLVLQPDANVVGFRHWTEPSRLEIVRIVN